MSDISITEKEGIFTLVDKKGNETRLFPEVKPDTSLSVSDKPADAKVVGDKFSVVEDKLSKVLYIDSFDASTGILTTRSENYTE